MSDNWIALIPEDPHLIPDRAKRDRARDRFAEIAPNADEIEVKISETVEFFDCGTNFERVLCPACQSEIPIAWWQDRMEEDYSHGFKLVAYTTLCCEASFTLHELIYEWPQGFGRFVLDAMNPNIGKLEEVISKYRNTLVQAVEIVFDEKDSHKSPIGGLADLKKTIQPTKAIEPSKRALSLPTLATITLGLTFLSREGSWVNLAIAAIGSHRDDPPLAQLSP